MAKRMNHLSNWKINNMRSDIFCGITALIIALPPTLFFKVQLGVSIAYGLYGANALGFCATPTGRQFHE